MILDDQDVQRWQMLSVETAGRLEGAAVVLMLFSDCRGIRTRKIAPASRPGLEALISPECISTSIREMAKPKPRPPN